MEFKVNHIFCNENSCADKLTNLGIDKRYETHCFESLPQIIRLEFFHNRFQLPFVRFV